MKRQAYSPAVLHALVLKWCRSGFAALGLGLATAAALGQPAAGTQAGGSSPMLTASWKASRTSTAAFSSRPASYNEAGWPRSWRVDYSVFKQAGNGNTATGALDFAGFMDTPNHGALSVQASLAQQGSAAYGFPGAGQATATGA